MTEANENESIRYNTIISSVKLIFDKLQSQFSPPSSVAAFIEYAAMRERINAGGTTRL